jgi:hypothetical protein
MRPDIKSRLVNEFVRATSRKLTSVGNISVTTPPAPGGAPTPAVTKAGSGAAGINIASFADLLEREVLVAPAPIPTLKACNSDHQKLIESDVTNLKAKFTTLTASVNASKPVKNFTLSAPFTPERFDF